MSFLDEMVSGQLSAEHIEQGTDKWNDVRCERFTASQMYRLCAPGYRLMTAEELANRPKSGAGSKTKYIQDDSGLPESAMGYILEKVAERLTGVPKHESYAYPLVYGKDMEQEAREYFETETGLIVDQVGFQIYSDYAGGSPDGNIGEDAQVEFKCPLDDAKQLQYLRLETPNDLMMEFPEYFWQVQSNLLFSGREKGYFVTYNPRFKEKRHKMKILEVPKDNWAHSIIIIKLEKAVEELLKQLSSL